MGAMKRTEFVDENEVPVDDVIREAVLERDAVTPAPVEVNSKDVRTLPLPATMEPVASATPEAPAKPQGRPTLDVAIERHKNLTPHIEAFCGRLESWVVTGATGDINGSAMCLLDIWVSLGNLLSGAKRAGAVVKVTPASRRRSWLKPGAHVELRKDVAEEFLSVYSQEELEALEVVKVLRAKALLKTGNREVGLVPLAHLRKSSRTL